MKSHVRSLICRALVVSALIPAGGSSAQTAPPNTPRRTSNAPNSTNGSGGRTLQQPNGDASPLQVTGERILVIDAACNACTGATLPLTVAYPPPARGNAGASTKLQLSVEHLTGDPKGDTVAVKATIEPANSSSTLPSEIKPGDAIPFAVRIQGILPAGTWKAKIRSGDFDLGEVQFIVPEVGFHLSLDAADKKTPTVVITRGEKASLRLKNEDAVGYRVSWDFRIDGKAATRTAQDKVTASGQALLEFEPQEEWFQEGGKPVCSWPTAWMEYFKIPCNWRAVFKDKETDGLITVRLASPECQNDSGAPTKLLPVHVVMAYYGSNKKSFWSYIGVLVLLLAGAILSLYVNFKLPDEQIRSDLKERLVANGRAISDLSMTLASRLRVLVGMENRLLWAKLDSLRWYSTEFEERRTGVSDCASRLARRVELLRKMGRLREDYIFLTANEVPPTLLARLEESFEQMGRMLDDFQTSDAELQDAELKLKEVQSAIANWRQPDSATIAELVALLQSLYEDLQGVELPANPLAPVVAAPPTSDPATTPGALAQSPRLKTLLGWSAMPAAGNNGVQYGLAYPSIRDLVEELKKAPPAAAQITGAFYYKKSLAAYRGDTLRRFLQFSDMQNQAENQDEAGAFKERSGLLIDLLATESWYAQRKARRLAWEMAEGIFPEDIKKEIEAKRVEIRLDRNMVRAFEPALFNVRFQDPKYDTCSALEEWRCILNFGHGPFDDKEDTRNFLEEEGWSVAHYFPAKGWYNLRASFRHEDSKDPIAPTTCIQKEVFVGPVHDEIAVGGIGSWIRRSTSNRDAILRLLLALIPAVLGLVSGAKDEFLKMDLFLALSTVFLLGFGSDQVKNLLSQKTKS